MEWCRNDFWGAAEKGVCTKNCGAYTSLLICVDGARHSRTQLSLLKSNMCDHNLCFLSFDSENALCLKGAG